MVNTVKVTGYAYHQNGEPAANAKGVAILSQYEIDDGVVVPHQVVFRLDDSGYFEIDLWPNERGTGSSSYEVIIYHKSPEPFESLIYVPEVDHDVRFKDILLQQPLPPVSDAEQILHEVLVSSSESKVAAAASKVSATESANSAEASRISMEASQVSATNSLNSANDSATSASEALASENAAKASEDNALASEQAAKTSETNAKASEDASAISANTASTKANEAATSESNAASSATSASNSATQAQNSATASATSAQESADSAASIVGAVTESQEAATNAQASASAAATSASNALTSETNAAISETNAANSESTASIAATNASNSASAASTSESNAATSATEAEGYASSAETSASTATNAASAAATSESNAAVSASSAESAKDDTYSYLNKAEQWATKLGSPVEGDEYSAKYWAKQAEAISAVDFATETVAGISRFGTQEEVIDGVLDNVIVSPKYLKEVTDNKVDKESGKGLSDENYTLAEKNKLSGIQANATANATNAQLRDRATHTGAQSISTIDGLQTSLDGKANTSTQVIAGTGLSGGGTLAEDRTFDVVYGDTSGTAAEGNDSRITGAMQKSANLADVDSAETARNNLGLGTNGSGNKTVSTDDPSGGVDGDIWLKVD